MGGAKSAGAEVSRIDSERALVREFLPGKWNCQIYGSGSYSNVFRCETAQGQSPGGRSRERLLPDVVAVKVLRGVIGKKSYFFRARTEAEIAVKMSSLQIGPRVYRVHETFTHTLVVMEFMDMTLNQFMKRYSRAIELAGNQGQKLVGSLESMVEKQFEKMIQHGFDCFDFHGKNIMLNYRELPRPPVDPKRKLQQHALPILNKVRLIDFDATFCSSAKVTFFGKPLKAIKHPDGGHPQKRRGVKTKVEALKLITCVHCMRFAGYPFWGQQFMQYTPQKWQRILELAQRNQVLADRIAHVGACYSKFSSTSENLNKTKFLRVCLDSIRTRIKESLRDGSDG